MIDVGGKDVLSRYVALLEEQVRPTSRKGSIDGRDIVSASVSA
jgi:hypothetical protein